MHGNSIVRTLTNWMIYDNTDVYIKWIVLSKRWSIQPGSRRLFIIMLLFWWKTKNLSVSRQHIILEWITRKRNAVPNMRKEGYVKKVDLFVIRLVANGKLSCSKPCRRCTKIIKRFYPFVQNIYYSDWDGSIIKTTRLLLTSDKLSSWYRKRTNNRKWKR